MTNSSFLNVINPCYLTDRSVEFQATISSPRAREEFQLLRPRGRSGSLENYTRSVTRSSTDGLAITFFFLTLCREVRSDRHRRSRFAEGGSCYLRGVYAVRAATASLVYFVVLLASRSDRLVDGP